MQIYKDATSIHTSMHVIHVNTSTGSRGNAPWLWVVVVHTSIHTQTQIHMHTLIWKYIKIYTSIHISMHVIHVNTSTAIVGCGWLWYFDT
jgi:hypothetical protein